MSKFMDGLVALFRRIKNTPIPPAPDFDSVHTLLQGPYCPSTYVKKVGIDTYSVLAYSPQQAIERVSQVCPRVQDWNTREVDSPGIYVLTPVYQTKEKE